jgi:dUTP pyrophosphatase
MDKNDVENYLSQLKEFEKKLNSDEAEDLSVFGDIDKLLGLLSNDIMSAPEFNTPIKIPAVTVKIKKLSEDAVIPSYSKSGDAGMDLTITREIENTSFSVTYGFGIALEIPRGYVGLVFPRSSIRNQELILSNSVGVIDSGYRGELQATFKKTNGLDSLKYKIGERAAQIVIMPYPNIELIEFKDLGDTERGSGGFGSTGQ